MKTFFILFLAVIGLSFLITGCSTMPTGDSVKSDAIAFLKDNKDIVKDGLVIVGKNAMSRAVKPEERKAIADQLWAVSAAFNSLATGKAVTQQELDATITAFTSKRVGGVTEFVSDASVVWSSVFKKLKIAEDPQLFIDYLLIFAQAAQEVAAIYRDNP